MLCKRFVAFPVLADTDLCHILQTVLTLKHFQISDVRLIFCNHFPQLWRITQADLKSLGQHVAAGWNGYKSQISVRLCFAFSTVVWYILIILSQFCCTWHNEQCCHWQSVSSTVSSALSCCPLSVCLPRKLFKTQNCKTPTDISHEKASCYKLSAAWHAYRPSLEMKRLCITVKWQHW